MFRGIPVRHLALLLLGPFLAETITMFFGAWMTNVASNTMGRPPWQQMFIASLASTGYATSSFIAGRWITPRFAPWVLKLSPICVVAVGLVAIATQTFTAFLICAFLLGMCIGHYYVPFQINMTHVRPFRTVAFSVAFYNMAWAAGSSIGPFAGSSMRLSTSTTLAALAIALVIAHTLLAVAARLAPKPDHEEHTHAAFAPTRRQWVTAVLAFGSVGLAIRGVYATLLPDLGRQHGWSDPMIGAGQCLSFLPVVLLSPLWAALRFRLQRPWIMLASMLLGIVGVLLIPATSSYALIMLGVLLVGTMESCVVFHAIYYTNADPDPVRRGRSVGVFEMVVGISFVLGPLVMGALAWDDARSWRPYLVSAALLVLAMGNVIRVELTARRRSPADPVHGDIHVDFERG